MPPESQYAAFIISNQLHILIYPIKSFYKRHRIIGRTEKHLPTYSSSRLAEWCSDMGSLRCSSAVVLAASVVLLLNADVALCGCSYKRIFAFGDSIIDTGNFVSILGNAQSALKEPPYGMTFFNHPTGRVCDGRVLVDFYGEPSSPSSLSIVRM